MEALGNSIIKGSMEKDTCAILELHPSEIGVAQPAQRAAHIYLLQKTDAP
jgi:hypothetical protein